MTLMPTHGSALAPLLGNEPLTPEKWLQIAKLTHQTRADYVRPAFPDRPAPIVLEDHELIDAYRAWESGQSPGKDKSRQLDLLARWKEAVRKVEAEAGVALLALLSAAQTFEEQNLGDEADTLLTIAEDEFPGFLRKSYPARADWFDLRDWCLVLCRDLNLLPTYMRSMRQPFGSGVPFHKAQGKRGPEPVPDIDDPVMPWD